MLTQERLKEILDYDSLTGVFTWKVRPGNSVHVGSVAGSNHNGYRQIMIGGKKYKAHRLAWLYEHGYFPEHGVDHRDRIKHHNFIDNLREVSQQCNMRNCGNFNHNSSGVKGIFWHKHAKKWMAQIKINKKQKYLGCYSDFDNAVCARLAGEQCLNWNNCDSSSPAFQFVKEKIQNST